MFHEFHAQPSSDAQFFFASPLYGASTSDACWRVSMSAKKVLVVFKKNFEEVHDESLVEVKSELDQLSSEGEVKVEYKVRETVTSDDFTDRDLAIILGGDGTLTSIAHSIGSDIPVMGVNSHPQDDDEDGSYGFYMGSDPESFGKDVRVALNGEAIVNILPRLQAEIITTSGKKILSDPALNDLIIANTHQYQPSRYRLERGSDSDAIDVIQRSSGCLFSTFVGQGAWYRHICDLEGKAFPRDEIDSKYLFVSRELSNDERRHGEYSAWTSKPTVITSDMHRGYVVSDGWDETHFVRGATITVSLDGPTLHLLTFREKIVDKLSDWLEG